MLGFFSGNGGGVISGMGGVPYCELRWDLVEGLKEAFDAERVRDCGGSATSAK